MNSVLESYMAYLQDVKQASHNTQISYRRDLNKAVFYFQDKGKDSFAEITSGDLEKYIKKMQEEKLSTATISRNIAALRSLFAYLAESGMIDNDPASGIRAPQVKKKAPDILSVEEAERLLECPDTHTIKGIRDCAMLEILYGTGIRVSELINLKVSDVDMKRSCIKCRDDGLLRMIPFGSTAKQAIRLYLDHARSAFLEGRKSDFLFTNVSGGSMSRQGFWKLLKNYASAAGIEKNITPHTLRHSFSAHMLENGADERSVASMLGHAQAATGEDMTASELRKLRSVYKKTHPRK